MSVHEAGAILRGGPKFSRDTPDQLIMHVPGLGADEARAVAHLAVTNARRAAPKLSGQSARRFVPIHGPGFFGIQWVDNYVWYQNQGIGAFTMNNLAGKIIPMWLDDPSGAIKSKNPKAKTRTTATGMRQTLIFRRAAKIGQTKRVRQRFGTMATVPASYPGAPGRVVRQELRAPWTAPGRIGGWIARGNVGVRWRHPGLRPRQFLEYGLVTAAEAHGLPVGKIMPSSTSANARVAR